MRSVLLVWLSLVVPFSAASSLAMFNFPFQIAYQSCLNSLNQIYETPLDSLLYADKTGFPSYYCQNESFITDLLGCFNHFSDTSEDAMISGYYILAYCPDLNPYLIQENANNTKTNIPQKVYSNWYHLYHNYYKNYDYAVFAGMLIIFYWVFILLVSMLYNIFFNKIFFSLIKKHSFLTRSLKSKVLFPSLLLNKKFKSTFNFLNTFTIYLPNRLDSIILFGYFILHLVLISVRWNDLYYVDYSLLPTNTSFSYVKTQMIAIRFSIIAASHLPLIFMFAGRNNLLGWFTKINYESYIQYHKFMSRIIIIDLFVHGMCYLHVYVSLSSYSLFIKTQFIICGILAFVCLVSLILTSLNYLRRNNYEFFLLAHYILATIFVACAYKHTEKFGYQEYVFAAIDFWAFDKLIRVLRILRFSIFPRKASSINFVNENTLRISVPLSNHWYHKYLPNFCRWHFKPGQYCFIYFMIPTSFYQSHPFTPIIQDKELIFFIKRKTGITNYLFDYLSKRTSLRLLIEGPYGGHINVANLKKYPNQILVVGGNGIPGSFDTIQNILLKSQKENVTGHIQLIWINRTFSNISWFKEQFEWLQNENPEILIDFSIYLTKENPEKTDYYENDFSLNASSIDNVISDEIKYSSGNTVKSDDIYIRTQSLSKKINLKVSLISGRPNLDQIFNDYNENLNGNIMFTTCGPAVLCDELRFKVSELAQRYKHGKIDYFEETQIW